jgi:hypothetical protein
MTAAERQDRQNDRTGRTTGPAERQDRQRTDGSSRGRDGRQILKAGNRQRTGRRQRGKRDLGIRGIYISLFLCYFLLLFAAAGKVRREKGRGL